MLISEATLQQAIDLTAAGGQPMYEQLGHHVAFPLVLRLAEALDITPNAPEPGATLPTGGPTYRTHAYLHEHGKVQRQMSLPPAEAEGSPIVTWVELCQ